MSGKFAGFTEDDIKKVQKNLPISKNVSEAEKNVMKNKKSQKVVIRLDSTRHKILESITANEGTDIPEEAKLCKEETVIECCGPQEKNSDVEKVEISEINNEQVTVNEKPVIKESTDHDKRFINLDEFQARQKAIEEQNNQRKELLAKALADRTKRTQEEAKRLNEIQDEFKKLDAVLSNDVKILRKKIELASLDYMEAQKRYLRVERMFLSAKVHLQKQLDKKEMLTEHLCTIIEQNEERKAEKLTQLINKLNLDNDDKDIETRET